MKAKKKYPFPSARNPIVINRSIISVIEVLAELSEKITSGSLTAQRRGKQNKIPTLPFRIIGPWGDFGVGYYSWCFKCFEILGEVKRHYYIKNRHDARFWGLPEKKAFCGKCLEERLEEMPAAKRYLYQRYQKRGYWENER